MTTFVEKNWRSFPELSTPLDGPALRDLEARIKAALLAVESEIGAAGTAGGDLSGSFPNPTVVTINGRAVSAVVFSDDARLTDQRTPLDGSVTAAKVNGALKPSGSAAAGDEALRALGGGGTQAAAGNDSRFPTAGQKNALTGTDGTPGSGNEYVTKQGMTAEQTARAAADALLVPLTQRNAANGYAGTDANSKVPWALLAGGAINVMDAAFGAKGDSNAAGTSGTQDRTAINNAIASAPSGATVFFPRPTGAGYRLNGPLIIDNDDVNLVFEPGAKLILTPNSDTNVIRGNTLANTNSLGTIRKKRVSLQGLYAEMNGASQGNVSGGIDGAVVLPGFEFVELDRCYVHNSKNTAYELRGSSVVRARWSTADSVYSGNNGNGFNVGQTGSTGATDCILMGCLATGVQDVAFWFGGFGSHRMSAFGCIVRSDPMKFFADGAINIGVNAGLLTSATAAFTANDVGKTITIAGAGPAGASLTCRIFSYISSTSVGLSVPASTTVSGATFSYGQDGAPARQVADAGITSGQSTLTSNTANFTSADIQKGVLIRGASGSGGDVYGKITAVASATSATVDFTAGTTVSGGRAIVNVTSSGVMSEGAQGNSDHLSIQGCHVDGTVNVGLGFSDSSPGTVGSKHDQATITGNTVANTYGTAMWVTGTQHSLGPNTIDNFHGQGLLVGGGNDFDERSFTLNGGSIKAAPDATGAGLTIQKDGSLTNWLQSVTLNGVVLDGNGGGTYGLRIEGKVRIVQLIGVESARWKRSGCWIGAKNGASPVDVTFIGGDYRNNNQGGNARGQDSVGIACEASCDRITISDVTATDDQAVKTQTDGLHWSGATRGKIHGNNFVGNATGPINNSFDSKTQYYDNKDVDGDYEGGAVLVAGTVVVSCTTVRNSGSGHWTPIELSKFAFGGTQGALYVSAMTTGTSFTVKSTDAGDTSSFTWKVR